MSSPLFEIYTLLPVSVSSCLRTIFLIYCYNQVIFVYGYLTTWVFTEVSKNFVGRLRPHFISVCQPSFNCSAVNNPYQFNAYLEYGTDYTCLNTDSTAVREARWVSFQERKESLGSCAFLVDRSSVGIRRHSSVSASLQTISILYLIGARWSRIFNYVYSYIMVVASSWCRWSCSAGWLDDLG